MFNTTYRHFNEKLFWIILHSENYGNWNRIDKSCVLMYLRAFVFLLLNKTNSKMHDMMDIKTANEIRVVDNFDFKMKLINQSNYSTSRSFEAPWIIFSKTLISLFKKTSGHNYDIFDVTTHICVFFDVATRNCTVFVRNYRSQCDRSYGVTTPQSYRNGGHGIVFLRY